MEANRPPSPAMEAQTTSAAEGDGVLVHSPRDSASWRDKGTDTVYVDTPAVPSTQAQGQLLDDVVEEAIPRGQPSSRQQVPQTMRWPARDAIARHGSPCTGVLDANPARRVPTAGSEAGQRCGRTASTDSQRSQASKASDRNGMSFLMKNVQAMGSARSMVRSLKSKSPASPLGRLSRSPTSNRSASGKQFSSMLNELNDEIEASKKPPEEFGLLTASDQHTLREAGKVPLEERVWAAESKTSEITAAEALKRASVAHPDELSDYARWNVDWLRMLCHAGVLTHFKRSQPIAVAGTPASHFYIIISGTVVAREPNGEDLGVTYGSASTPKNQILMEREDSQTRSPQHTQAGQGPSTPSSYLREQSSKNAPGHEVKRLYSGHCFGTRSLQDLGQDWKLTYVAMSKNVEVLTIDVSLPMLESISRPLKWAFDFQTLVQVLHAYRKSDEYTKRQAKLAKFGDKVSADHNVIYRSQQWVQKISTAMRSVPFFQQLPQDVCEMLSHSIEVQHFDARTVVWEQSRGPGQPLADRVGSFEDAGEDTASMFHVVLQGEILMFKRDSPPFGQMTDPPLLKDVWGRTEDVFECYGHCVQTLVACDSMGEPTPLAHECTMIAQPGTILVRVRNPKQGKAIKNCAGSLQLGMIRQILVKDEVEWSLLEKERLMNCVIRDSFYFKRLSRTQVQHLLSRARLEKFHKGETLTRQGQEADALYFILDGEASVFVASTDLAVQSLGDVLDKWESPRNEGDLSILGVLKQKIGSGTCVGESEVVEKTSFCSTIVANENVEAIRISASDYTDIMWDLCDGEPLDLDFVRALLSQRPTDRGKEDLHKLIDLLHDSDFLSQFPLDIRIQMTEGMKIFECGEDELICSQNGVGDTFYLIVAGSVSLHKAKDGVSDKHNHGDVNPHSWVGPCRRVLGIGDSFGELAFIQSRPHPTSAVARTVSTLITISRRDIESAIMPRMISFMENPSVEAMQDVFAKDVSDRNEKDILLLLNYLEMNPFLKQFSYPALVDCAHHLLRHDVPAGQHFRVRTDSSTQGSSHGFLETRIYIVHGGSMQITPKKKHSPITLHLQGFMDQPLTFGEKQGGAGRKNSQARNEIVLFSGYLYLAMADAPSFGRTASGAARAGSKKPRQSKPDEARPSTTPSDYIPKRRVFAIDLQGSITYTATMSEKSGLTELGNVSEISSLERITLPRYQFALQVCIRGQYWTLASSFRTEMDSFINVICNLNPYFESLFVEKVWFEGKVHLLRSISATTSDSGVGARERDGHAPGSAWVEVLLRVTNDGKLMYSALRFDDVPSWLCIGELGQCALCQEKDLKEKNWSIIVSIASRSHKTHVTEWVFAMENESARAAWLDRFGTKCSVKALSSRYLQEGNTAVDQTQVHRLANLAAMDKLFSDYIAMRRGRRFAAEKRVRDASIVSFSTSKPQKDKTEQLKDPGKSAIISMDASVFVGYGSVFCTQGEGLANAEGCLLLSLSIGEWERVQRRQLALEIDNAMSILRSVPMLERSAHRDIHNMVHHGFVTIFPANNKISCASFSTKHVHILLAGSCKLCKKGIKETHVDKVRNKVLSSVGNQGDDNLIKIDCPACSGDGIEGRVPDMSQRISLCPLCNGCGFLQPQEPDEVHTTEIGELGKGAVLTDAIPSSDSMTNYELVPTSVPVQLLSVKLDLWEECKYKWERAQEIFNQNLKPGEPKLQKATTVRDISDEILDNARTVRAAANRGPLKYSTVSRQFVKIPSLEEKVRQLMDRTYSQRNAEIDTLLNTHRPEPRQIFVKSKSETRARFPLMAPSSTMKNKFEKPKVPQLHLDRVYEDEMRAVFLTSMPATERGYMKTARISSLLGSSSASNPFDVQARMPKLPPLSGQHLSTDRAEALLTWRPQNQIEGLELGYNEPVKLRHGNAFSLDRRQKKIFTCVQELLSPSNFVSFSSVSGFRKPGLEPARTVDQIELCNALTAYKLLENKITHERVVRLEAICKADAMRIFKKHTRNDVGGHVPRLSQVCAIVIVFCSGCRYASSGGSCALILHIHVFLHTG